MKVWNFLTVGPSSENGPMCIICVALPSANDSNVNSVRDLGSFLDPTCSIASWNDR